MRKRYGFTPDTPKEVVLDYIEEHKPVAYNPEGIVI
jgi:hypothetical protein